MTSLTFLTVVSAFLSLASSHMLLAYPPAFRYEGNPNVPSGSVDYSLTSPLDASGSNFPCKGYQSDLGTPAGASVATWAAGGTYNFTIGGSAAHDGGSCQAALSYDKGKTFTVIHSYVGGCPTVSPAGGSFNFQVPSDAPQGAAMFAWTWFNQVGNREMYMDCASVTITGSASGKRAVKRTTNFSSRPSLFVANLGNGCTTIESTDTTFPDPGPDVTDVTKTPGGVTGTCKQVAGIGDFSSGSGSGSGSASTASSPASSIASSPASSTASSPASSIASSPASSTASSPTGSAATSSAAPVSIMSSTDGSAGTTATPASSYAAQTSSESQAVTMSSAASTATATGTSTGGLSLNSDGSCGGTFGCQGSIHGSCCSEWGWCGSTSAYCGSGCQSAFGSCGSSNTNPSGSSGLQISTDKTCGPTTSNTCQGSTYGNCCSQYGYCGSTDDYCGTGCQGGFGTCGDASSPSSMASASPSGTPLSSAAGSSATPGGVYTTPSASSADSTGFIGVTQSTSQPSGFITMVSSSTAMTTSTSSKNTSNLITIIPTHLRRHRRS